MNDLFKLISAGLNAGMQPISERRVARDDVTGFGISTVLSEDMGYETALGDTKGNWHPVERYDSREEAVAGHPRWVARVAAGERSFTELGYGDLIDPEPMILS